MPFRPLAAENVVSAVNGPARVLKTFMTFSSLTRLSFISYLSTSSLILSGHEDIGEWAQNGLIIALDDFISGQPAVYNNVIDGLWPSCSPLCRQASTTWL